LNSARRGVVRHCPDRITGAPLLRVERSQGGVVRPDGLQVRQRRGRGPRALPARVGWRGEADLDGLDMRPGGPEVAFGRGHRSPSRQAKRLGLEHDLERSVLLLLECLVGPGRVGERASERALGR